jgi:hypothetical protein
MYLELELPDTDPVIGSPVSLAAGYWLEGQGVGVRVPVAVRFLSRAPRPDRFLSNGYWGPFPRNKEAGT